MNYRVIRNDELYHYGVKGMKWGVRKAKDSYKKRVGKKKIENKSEPIEKINVMEATAKWVGEIDIGKYKGVDFSISNNQKSKEARKIIKEKFNDSYNKEIFAKNNYDDERTFEQCVKDENGKVLFSRNEFKNKMRLDYILVGDKTYVAGYYDGGTLGGHVLEIQCSNETGKVIRVGMWG